MSPSEETKSEQPDRKWSALATRIKGTRFRFRRIDPWGIVIHTSGRGIVEKAHNRNRYPSNFAIDYYRKQGSVHYFINWEGEIFQFMPDTWRGAHVGISSQERKRMLDEAWVLDFTIENLSRWRRAWPSFRSPQYLYPTKSPNSCYIGIEMLPLLKPIDQLWFTMDQHQAVVDLIWERAKVHQWPEGWQFSPRLVGHEDIDPYGRWDKKGGWDPGALRKPKRFDFDWVRTSRPKP